MADRINVLHLIWGLTPGGAERQVVTLATGLHGERFNVRVGCLSERGALADELEKAGIEVVFFNKQKGIDFAVRRALTSYLRDNNISIIHTHIFTANLWGRLAARVAGTPVVIAHEHSDFSLGSFVRRTADVWLASKTNRIIAVSEDLRKRIIAQEGISADKVVTVYNGVDWARMKPNRPREEVRKELGLGENEIAVGIIGALEPRKDHITFLHGAKLILSKKDNVRFVIVGDGPLKGALKEEARNAGLGDKVSFFGVRGDIPDILGALDIYASTSVTEGISIALLEAMYAGLPSVVTKVGGMPEVIEEGVTGYMFNPKDISAFSDAVIGLAGSAGLRKGVGTNAHKAVFDKYSAETMVSAVKDLYESFTYLIKK